MSNWKVIEAGSSPGEHYNGTNNMKEENAHAERQNYINTDLEKVKSSSKQSDINPFTEPPDGGLNAWLKVIGCFLIYSNIWGFTLTYGVFQYYYRHNFLSDSSPSAISWIGTVQSWLLILGGVLSGPLFDRGWYRVMLLVGNAGVIFGIFMLSLSHTYWQVFLSQGICMGLGAGLLYVPSLALVGLSFSKKRSLAQGIVTSGIAVGGVAYILEFNHLTATKDFGFAVRTMGLTATGLCLIALPALLKGTSGSVMPSMTENCVANAISALAKPRPARKLYDSAAFKDIAFVLFTLCSFATFLGYLVFYFFVVSYCKEVLGFSQTWSMNVLMISIASSFFGRLSAGVVAHYLGAMVTWMCCAAVSGILSFSWITVTQGKGGIIVIAVFWGFCSAGLVTLPAAVFPDICPDPRRLGTRTGMSWGISAFSSLIGPPIAGALLKDTGNFPDGEQPASKFLGPQIFSGCTLLFGSFLIAILWAVTLKQKKK